LAEAGDVAPRRLPVLLQHEPGDGAVGALRDSGADLVSFVTSTTRSGAPRRGRGTDDAQRSVRRLPALSARLAVAIAAVEVRAVVAVQELLPDRP